MGPRKIKTYTEQDLLQSTASIKDQNQLHQGDGISQDRLCMMLSRKDMHMENTPQVN